MITQCELISILDYCRDTGVFKWKNGKTAGCASGHGYIVIRINRVLYYAHRLAWLYVYGEWPKMVIDHINCDKKDNRIENLRDATHADNSWNQHSTNLKVTKSGVRGVQKNHKGWQAIIWRKGVRKCLGTFNTIDAAKVAYLDAKNGFAPA